MEGSAVLSRSGTGRRRRPGVRPPFVQRYWAFISYSHADAATAEWLHRALERFRVPAELVGRRTERFLIPRTLTPIFQDRSELAASSDLSSDINDSIEGSRHLIVLCSPATVASRWVNAEIRTFKRLRPDGKVLAAIVGGEPHSADPALECLPVALSERYDAKGRLVGEDAEPIAADLRPQADGRDMGLLKLVAGMLDVRLDELVQREERQRHRRWMLISAGSLAGMLLTTGLAVVAVQARDEAREQRREAESLVGFMIGDLKDKLEPVGRLDALDAVGGKVLAYYEHQDKAGLSDDALAQRSRALTLMGDIAQRRGDLNGALRRYQEGLASTGEALRRDPANPQRLFDHAQNVFWIGTIALARGQYDQAATWLLQYRQLAERMIAAEPRNPKWQLEGIYAGTNLGILELQRRHYDAAIAPFQQALAAVARLRSWTPDNSEYVHLEHEGLGYLSDALERSGRLLDSLPVRSRQIGLIEQRLRQSPNDVDLKAQLLIAMRSAARQLSAVGERTRALNYSTRAVALADELVRTEPGNRDWQDRSVGTRLDHAQRLLEQGQLTEAAAANEIGCAGATRIAALDHVVRWTRLSRQCLENRTRLNLAAGDKGQAMLSAGQLLAQLQTNRTADRIEDDFSLATTQLLIGDIQEKIGDGAAAQRAWTQALASWPRGVAEVPRQLATHRDLLKRLGRTSEAAALDNRLRAIGWRG